MNVVSAYQDDVADVFTPAREQLGEVIARLMAPAARLMTHSEAERLIQTDGLELLRRLFQGYIDSHGLGEAEGEVRDASGLLRTHRPKGGRGLMTLFGEVRVHERQGYGAAEESVLYPLDGKLNLPKDTFSFGTRRRTAEESSKISFDESVATVNTTTGARVAKRQAEQVVQRAATDFEAFYQQREAPQESPGTILVTSFDQKGIVMRTEDLREATRKAAEQSVHTYATRLSPGEKQNRKRMAAVAAAYTIVPHVRTPEDILRAARPTVVENPIVRPKPENKRVWASVVEDCEDVIHAGFEEALRRDPGRAKDWVSLVDGNKDQLRFLRRCVRHFGVTVTIILDFVHVLEYLWKAAHAFHGKGNPACETWVRARGLEILRGKAGYVAGGMRRSATLRGLRGRPRKAVDKAARYLLKHKRYLRYDEYLAKGYPIATGVIEGTCRHLLVDRLDITGARWGLLGAEAVIKLRALRSSGDFDEYWAFHEAQERRRNHESNYAGGCVPKIHDPICSRKLRLVQ